MRYSKVKEVILILRRYGYVRSELSKYLDGATIYERVFAHQDYFRYRHTVDITNLFSLNDFGIEEYLDTAARNARYELGFAEAKAMRKLYTGE